MKKLWFARKQLASIFALAASILIIFSGYSPVQAAKSTLYPKFDISGYKKWEYKKADVNPTRNYFSGLTQLGGFYQTYSGGPWQERLKLRIIGELSKDLSVTYNIQQQPETPDKFDVQVKYKDTKLTFGDFSANFSGNEFASVSKTLNGVMVTSKNSWHDIVLVPSTKLKSQTQALTSQKGNNTKGPYSLGRGSIVEGSEKIELNNVPLVRNVDYTINYFEGKVTFNKILTTLDEFKYSYEYTNMLDLFFPSLSKRDFFGFQSRFTIDPKQIGKAPAKKQPILLSARETFPSTGSLEASVVEAESSGRYKLKHHPIVDFSESVTFLGAGLEKNTHYIIRYEEGQLKLLTDTLPTKNDPLIIEYKYYKISQETDSILGIGARGPYKLKNQGVVSESERVKVNGQLYVRNLDYSIDYPSGQIIFGTPVNETSQINVTYKYKALEKPAKTKSKFPTALKVGTTYLRESAKRSTGTNIATVIESITGQTIVNNNYQAYLSNRPLADSSEATTTLIIKVDGQTLTREVDYTVPMTYIDPITGYAVVTPEATLAYINDRTDTTDGYGTSTILFLDQSTITPTSSVTVTYTYQKNIVGKHSGVGNSTTGPYYLRNVRNIVPGSETLQVWEQGSSSITTYTRNSSFEADAGSTGYSINYDADNPYIVFNDPLSTTKNFQLIYQYVPPQGATNNSDLAQSVLGFDSSFSIGKIFKVHGAYARSETDQVFVAESSSESFTGNGTKTYLLHSSKDLIENSEKVSVNNNTLNKDIDYFVSYSKPGKIIFYYITPTTADAIVVDYQYQSLNGIATGQTSKVDSAYSLGAETKVFDDTLTVSGVTKKIGYDFTPIGGTSIGLGSTYNNYNVNFKPKKFHSFVANYSYKENKNPLNTYRNRFLKSYDNSVSLGLNPYKLGQVSFTYRDYRTIDDLLPAASAHASDNQQQSYSLSLIPKKLTHQALAFTQKYSASRTFSQKDTLRDSNNFSESTIDYLAASGKLKYTKRFSANYSYQQSDPKTISLKSSSTEATHEAVYSQKRVVDSGYGFSADLTFPQVYKFVTRISILDHKEHRLYTNFSASNEVISTRNQTFHSDLIPFKKLTTSLDHNRTEQTSVVVGGVNPKTERLVTKTNYAPFSWLSANWAYSQSESIPQTGLAYKTSGKGNTYKAVYKPIALKNFKLVTNFSASDNRQVGPSGTSSEVTTNTNTFSQNYTLNFYVHKLFPSWIGFTLENYRNANNHPITTSKIDTETENQTINAGFKTSFLKNLSFTSNYSRKRTRVIKDLVVSPQNRVKSVFDNKLSYKISKRGTLSFTRQDENNGGEVQGGKVAALNIRKTTQTLSLSIIVPIDNVVLTSFVFKTSLKTVDYKNLNKPDKTDDFLASLLTFEGTLNF